MVLRCVDATKVPWLFRTDGASQWAALSAQLLATYMACVVFAGELSPNGSVYPAVISVPSLPAGCGQRFLDDVAIDGDLDADVVAPSIRWSTSQASMAS